MRKPSTTLTPPELEIMRLVWDGNDVTVRDVYEALLARRKVAYTTVLTVMTVLEKKGYLVRRRGERPSVYRAAQPEQAVERSMVREFLERVFSGASRPLLVHLIKDRRLSPEDLEQLAREVKAERARKEKAR